MSENKTSKMPAISEQRFNQVVSVLMAIVTVLVALISYLQNDASARDDRANRDSKKYSLEALGRDISGDARVNYDYNSAYQAWYELDLLAVSASNAGDDAAAARYTALRDQVLDLSPLLSSQYFDQAQGVPDIARYESDLYYVATTALEERFAASAAVKEAWDYKANTYIIHLTLLAVSLFLYGLSIAIASSTTRWIFAGVGTATTLFAVGWAAVLFFQPVPALPDAAIDAYAQGVGLLHQDKYEEAVKAFDEALTAAPKYANALSDRAGAHASLGDHQAAAADYEAALAAGSDTATTAGNLGWTYYILGRFDDAANTDRRALAADAEEHWVRFNLGLTLLASGQADAAKAEYAEGMDRIIKEVAAVKAAGEEPPAYLWTDLDAAALDLESLLITLDGGEGWSETPPQEAINNSDAVKTTSGELLTQLKELSTSLEYTSAPPTGSLTATITNMQFGEGVYDDQGNFVSYNFADTFPYGAKEALVLFDYEGMQDGQDVVFKVYHNGEEDLSLRVIDQWSLGASGGAEKPISFAYSNVYVLSPGEYTVEIYVDSHLAQTGTFVVEQQ